MPIIPRHHFRLWVAKVISVLFVLVAVVAGLNVRIMAKDARAPTCSISNPITLHGTVNTWGSHGHTCELQDGQLRMEVSDRGGDFALCCVDLSVPIPLSDRDIACATVSSEQAETRIDAKLEDAANNQRQVFVAHEQPIPKGAQRTFQHALTKIERGWQTSRVCLAAVGSGPAPNTVTLHAIGFAR